MKTFKESLKCLALAFVCALLLGGCVLIWRLPKIVNHQADATRAALLAEAHIAEVDANDRLADALSHFDRQLTAGLAEVHLASVNADKRTGEALDIVDRFAVTANTQMSTLNATVADTLKPVGEVAQQVDDAAPLVLDCEFNPDCAFNRFQGVTKAVEQTALVIAKEAPAMAVSVDKIAASSAGVAASADATGKEVAIAAKRFNAPQTKWQQFRTWLLVAARLTGDFF
jgi:hypothetical protein